MLDVGDEPYAVQASPTVPCITAATIQRDSSDFRHFARADFLCRWARAAQENSRSLVFRPILIKRKLSYLTELVSNKSNKPLSHPNNCPVLMQMISLKSSRRQETQSKFMCVDYSNMYICREMVQLPGVHKPHESYGESDNP
jgi:hypothetical protein